jgi:hypothetical protein
VGNERKIGRLTLCSTFENIMCSLLKRAGYKEMDNYLCEKGSGRSAHQARPRSVGAFWAPLSMLLSM